MARFQLVGLEEAQFAGLFELDEAQLAQRGMRRQVADEAPGFPCRISLEDAAIGEELLLLSYAHQPADSPYRASGPIFVRRGARRARLAPGMVPDYVTGRLMSLRAYDSAHLMIAAEVCEGEAAGARLDALFAEASVAYVHLHNARRGCFSCLAQRVTGTF
jgi:hypothetical protein